jgi:cysteine desulfurase
MTVYLDNNATTKPLPEVVQAVLSALETDYANPASPHAAGFASRRTIEEARRLAADCIGARAPSEIIFTSGATESIALAFSSAEPKTCAQFVLSTVEHSAVLDAAKRWAGDRRVERIPVGIEGVLNLEQLEQAVARTPSFVSVMQANNETGVIFDIAAIGRICRKHNARLHVDAVQAPGRLPINVADAHCDYLSLSAHKFHGPKGVGILYVREGAQVRPVMPGHRDRGFRGGTENTPAIAGLGAAVRALADWRRSAERMRQLRDQLEQGILKAIPECAVNGAGADRLCNTSNIHFPHRDAADLVQSLSGRFVFVSAGAACSTGGEPSHVIQAMGLGRQRANSSLRFSLSRLTTAQEIEEAIAKVRESYTTTVPLHWATA